MSRPPSPSDPRAEALRVLVRSEESGDPTEAPGGFGPTDRAVDDVFRRRWDDGPRAAFLDRWAQWRDDPRVAVAALAILAVVAGLFWYRAALGSDRSEPSTPRRASRTTTAPVDQGHQTPTTVDEVVVHVAGAVVEPGVYHLPSRARVTDAIDEAGGPASDADLDRLNLAAHLVDGEQVRVPHVGEVLPSAGNAAEPASGAPLNLNLATEADLEALPGIGPTLARAILDERQRRGGFGSVDDLLKVRGIGERRLDDLRALVSV